MMNKTITSILTSFMLIFSVAAFAQEEQTGKQEKPQKGDIALSVNFGIGSHIGVSAPAPNLAQYELAAPASGMFDKKPILNIEGRWFLSDKWALKLNGGFSYGYNPAYGPVPGTTSGGGTIAPGSAEIPSYNAVPKTSSTQFAVSLGAARYRQAGQSGKLFFHLGGEVNYAYGRVKAFADDEMYSGVSIGEAYSIGVAPVTGFDYFFAKVMFAGIEVRPLAYSYSVYSERPQPGLGLLSADNHSFSFIVRPMIKFGVKF